MEQGRLHARMNVVKSTFRLKCFAERKCFVKIGTVFNEFRAKGSHRAVFLRVIPVWHNNSRFDTGLRRRIGDRLSMIPACCRKHAFFTLCFWEMVHEIDAATHFKTTRWVMIFVLNIRLESEPLGQFWIVNQRCGF